MRELNGSNQNIKLSKCDTYIMVKDVYLNNLDKIKNDTHYKKLVAFANKFLRSENVSFRVMREISINDFGYILQECKDINVFLQVIKKVEDLLKVGIYCINTIDNLKDDLIFFQDDAEEIEEIEKHLNDHVLLRNNLIMY